MFSNLITLLNSEIATYGPTLLKKLFFAIVFFLIVYFLAKKLVKKVKAKISYQSIGETKDYVNKTSKLIGAIVFIVCMIFAVLAVFQIMGINTALLMASLSVGIGYAMKPTISNMVSGMMMFTNKKVAIGDFVQIMGKYKKLGTIADITLRYTVVTTLDKRKIIIPNSSMIETPIKTLKSEKIVRGNISFTMPRHCDLQQIKDKIKFVITEQDDVLYKDDINTLVTGFDERGINLVTYFFVNPAVSGSGFGIKAKVRIKMQEELKKYGIQIPYIHVSLGIDN